MNPTIGMFVGDDEIERRRTREAMTKTNQPLSEAEMPCIWFNDPDTDNVWQTDCGRNFEITDGSPSENEMKFCYHCGRQLEELRASECETE